MTWVWVLEAFSILIRKLQVDTLGANECSNLEFTDSSNTNDLILVSAFLAWSEEKVEFLYFERKYEKTQELIGITL